jgi:hypothetical protein
LQEALQEQNLSKVFAAGLQWNDTKCAFIHPCILSNKNFKERNMKVKINEDWLATIIAFALLILSMINVIKPAWVTF